MIQCDIQDMTYKRHHSFKLSNSYFSNKLFIAINYAENFKADFSGINVRNKKLPQMKMSSQQVT